MTIASNIEPIELFVPKEKWSQCLNFYRNVLDFSSCEEFSIANSNVMKHPNGCFIRVCKLSTRLRNFETGIAFQVFSLKAALVELATRGVVIDIVTSEGSSVRFCDPAGNWFTLVEIDRQ